MDKVVFAVHAHPDDIEFMMAGTLLLLRERGWQIHYMTLADGNCGSAETGPEETARIRAAEAREAAAHIGATFHESITRDMEVFYTKELLRKLAATIRKISPDVVLVPSPEDYMEDHMNACRLAVGAAFIKGMPNYSTDPPAPPIDKDVTLYHAMPHGLRDGLNRAVRPDFVIDISTTIDAKEEALAMHKSQKEWLDRSQGFDSYLNAMRDMSAQVGDFVSPAFDYAEGWRRHSHLGYSAKPIDPLGDELKNVMKELS